MLATSRTGTADFSGAVNCGGARSQTTACKTEPQGVPIEWPRVVIACAVYRGVAPRVRNHVGTVVRLIREGLSRPAKVVIAWRSSNAPATRAWACAMALPWSCRDALGHHPTRRAAYCATKRCAAQSVGIVQRQGMVRRLCQQTWRGNCISEGCQEPKRTCHCERTQHLHDLPFYRASSPVREKTGAGPPEGGGETRPVLSSGGGRG